MNLIDKDALIESLGIETVCDECEHERLKYHCDLDPVEACTRIIEAPVISVTTESAEKAIEVLKNAAWLGAVYSFEETEEAVKTAITALQMAQTQSDQFAEVSKKGDLISRQALLRQIDIDAGGEPGYYGDTWKFIDTIKMMPSAQPKTGKWVYGEHDTAMCDGYRCDKCGFFVPWDYKFTFIDFINDYHFCPGCGAKMECEEQNE